VSQRLSNLRANLPIDSNVVAGALGGQYLPHSDRVQSEILILPLHDSVRNVQAKHVENESYLFPTRSGLAATGHEATPIRATLRSVRGGGELVVAACISVI
jgi:hypothetical protein